MFRFSALVSAFLFIFLGLSASAYAGWQSKVSQSVLDDPDLEEHGFFVLMRDQADLSAASAKTKTEKGEIVFQSLTNVSNSTQPALVGELEALGVQYTQYWIVNAIWVEAGQEILQRLARRTDVAKILPNSRLTISELEVEEKEPTRVRRKALTYGWNIDKMDVWRVWDAGFSGQGAVVGSIDTGVTWDLPELIDQYRGWDGSTADHNYNWHDAVASGGTDCPAGSLEPCDEFNHGTGTLALAVSGQLVGDPSDEQIGVAPQAQWMTCRAAVAPFDASSSLATAMECLQWMLAPTDLNDQFPDPSKAPDVLNTSWGCDSSFNCSDPQNMLEPVFDNLRAAGIFLAAAAGNSGPNCDTVLDAPPMLQSTTATGSSGLDGTLTEIISPFSSRGPAATTGLIKPDVVAPGQGIPSFNRLGDPITVNGTSAASPHLAGVVALLISASPALAGNVDALEMLVEQYADPMTSAETCGGVAGTEIPNNTWGFGRINAWNSYNAAAGNTAAPSLRLTVAELSPPRPNPFNPRTVFDVTLRRAGLVNLQIVDVRGRSVRQLESQWLKAGIYPHRWNGRDDAGQAVSSGVYLAVLRLDEEIQAIRSLVLLE